MSRMKSVKCAKLRAAFGEKASCEFSYRKRVINEKADGFHTVEKKFCFSSTGLGKKYQTIKLSNTTKRI